MITAAISTILGMLGGVLPDLMKLIASGQQAKNERALLELQSKLQIEIAQNAKATRLEELHSSEYVAQMNAMRDQIVTIVETQGRATGIKWVDTVNAVMRPFCTFAIILLFLAIAGPFVWVVTKQMADGGISPQDAAKVIFGSLVGDAILGVVGFLYGYRSSAKR